MPERNLIAHTKANTDRFLKTKNPADCIAVYHFYLYTALWQKTNQIRCTVGYTAEGLKISQDRTRKAKTELKKMGMIENVMKLDPKTGKVSAWYVKLKFLVKQEHCTDIQEGVHPSDSGDSVHPLYYQCSGNRKGNAYSNSINTKLKSLETGDKLPPDLLFDSQHPSYPKRVDEILVRAIKAGGFSDHTRFKYRKGVKKDLSKTYSDLVRCVREIDSGFFFRNREWDRDWIAKQKIERVPPASGYQNWDRTEKVILKSCIRAGEARETGKDYVPKSLVEFFYNPSTKKSRFLYFLNRNIMTLDKIKTQGLMKQIPEPIRQDINDRLYGQIRKISGVQFWGNMNQLYTWYKKNSEQLRLYNLAYNDNSWAFHCIPEIKFFGLVVKFLELGFWGSRPLTTGEVGWMKFRDWMKDQHNIEIAPPDGWEDRADEKIESRKTDWQDRQLAKEIDKIEQEYRARGDKVPGIEMLKTMAEERMNGSH